MFLLGHSLTVDVVHVELLVRDLRLGRALQRADPHRALVEGRVDVGGRQPIIIIITIIVIVIINVIIINMTDIVIMIVIVIIIIIIRTIIIIIIAIVIMIIVPQEGHEELQASGRKKQALHALLA